MCKRWCTLYQHLNEEGREWCISVSSSSSQTLGYKTFGNLTLAHIWRNTITCGALLLLFFLTVPCADTHTCGHTGLQRDFSSNGKFNCTFCVAWQQYSNISPSRSLPVSILQFYPHRIWQHSSHSEIKTQNSDAAVLWTTVAVVNLERCTSVIPVWDYSSSFESLHLYLPLSLSLHISLAQHKNKHLAVTMFVNTWDMTLMRVKKLRQLSLARKPLGLSVEMESKSKSVRGCLHVLKIASFYWDNGKPECLWFS